MKIFRNFESAKGIKNPVVTIGSFDGVHVGHKAILKRLNELAKQNHGESVVITFEPHPRKVLYPETIGKDLWLITSYEEKLKLLAELGIDNVIVVEFTKEFSKITNEQFVKGFLHNILKVKVVVAGFDHHFGFNKRVITDSCGIGKKDSAFLSKKYPHKKMNMKLLVLQKYAWQ